MSKLKIALLSYRSAPFGGGQGVYVHDISKALAMKGHQVDIISGPPYPKIPENVNLIQLPGLDLFQTFSFKERVKIFWEKKSKTRFDYFEFCSVLFGGFPEMATFGYRAKDHLINNSDYDIVIDNQSISYGMLEIQKLLPLIEIIRLRLGVQELTRVGMGRLEMEEVARLYARVLIHGEDPSKVKNDVKDLKSNFHVIRYCFNEEERTGYPF